ncbi:MAG: TonB-dependent receptor [Chryseolinea sp.]
MKKSRLNDENYSLLTTQTADTRLFKIMMTFIIVVLQVFQGHAKDTTLEQQKISIVSESVSIKQVLKQIEKQSDFRFFYNNQQVDTRQTVSVHLKNVSLSHALEEIFKGTQINYKVTGRQVLLYKIEQEASARRPDQTTNIKFLIFQVSGIVTSEAGESMPGVNVLVKGMTTGTSTDSDGRYKIEVPEGTETLVFSFIGYKTIEIPIGGRTTLDLAMEPDVQSLQEVVVVGYNSQTKGDITGAIDIVKSADLDRITATSISDKLQGRAPGVTVRPSGQPGKAADIVIRGVTNFTDSGPLWVIDGIQTTDSRDINPNDVESIQILKDAASTSQYGARGANGVIIVTTKRGRSGPMKVDFDARAGIQNITKKYDLMAGPEWAETTQMMYDNLNDPTQPVIPAVGWVGTVPETDWQEAFIQQGTTQQYDLAVSGGTNDANYRVSGGYFNNKGAIVGTNFERYTARINGGLKGGRISIQESLLFSKSLSDEMDGNPFGDAIRMFPVIPVYDASQPTGFGIGTADAPTLGTNPVANQSINDNTVESYRIMGNVTGELKIFDYLSYKISFGTEFNNSNFYNKRKEGQVFRSQPEPYSRYSEQKDQTFNTIFENFLVFNKQFNKHAISALVGYAENKYHFRSSLASIKDVAKTSAGDYYFELSNGTTTGVSGKSEFNGLRSFIGHLDYDYAGKYLLSANFRRDGSSRFGPSNKYGNFPSLSVGWRISEEDFFKGVAAFSNLKLRASYGSVGNDAIGNYKYDAFINTNARYILGTGQQVAPGSIQRYIANPSVQWNAQNTTNFGLDIGLFNDRLSITTNYYISKSEKLLLNAPIPWTNGYADPDFGQPDQAPPVNVGSMENKGIEMSITYAEVKGDFSYSITANASHNKNKILSLGSLPTNELNAGIARSITGEELGRFFVIQTDGLFQQGDDILGSAQPTAQPGDQRYKDVNGRDENNKLTGLPDGQITADDRVYVGSPWPKLLYSLNLNASYKGIDLSMFWNGKYRVTANNGSEGALTNTAILSNYKRGLNPWTPANTETNTPRAVYQAPVRGDTDRFLDDASFLRLANIQIGYSLPQSTLEKLGGIKTLRISLTAQNLLTITNYSGLDPDFTNAGLLQPGQDNTSFPNVRSFLAGLQLGF